MASAIQGNQRQLASLTQVFPSSWLTCKLELYLEVPLSGEQPLHQIAPDDLLLFVKLYDPVQHHLTYLGSQYASRTQKLPELLPMLNQMAGFSEGMALEVKLRLVPCCLTAEQAAMHVSSWCSAQNTQGVSTYAEGILHLCCCFTRDHLERGCDCWRRQPGFKLSRVWLEVVVVPGR